MEIINKLPNEIKNNIEQEYKIRERDGVYRCQLDTQEFEDLFRKRKKPSLADGQLCMVPHDGNTISAILPR